MKKVLNDIAFWAIYGTWYVLSLLPMWVHYLLSDILYLLVAYIFSYRHRVIWKNLSNSYPDKSEKELKSLQRKCYRHMCNMVAETVKYTTISRKNIMRRMTFKGVEQVVDILNSGQSIALLLGHYGNWEWVTSFALWLPSMECDYIWDKLYHPLKNKVMTAWCSRCATALDPCASPRVKPYDGLSVTSRRGRTTMLGYINDQVPKWENIHHWLTFLNHEDTPVFTGIERITHSAATSCGLCRCKVFEARIL